MTPRFVEVALDDIWLHKNLLRSGRFFHKLSEDIREQTLAAVEASGARVIKQAGVRAQDRAVDDAAEDQFMVAGRMVAV